MSKMNKLGIGLYFPVMFLWAMFMSLVVIASIFIMSSSFKSRHLDVQEAEADTFAFALLYMPRGLSYYDSSIHRSYPGVIPEEYFIMNNVMNDVNGGYNIQNIVSYGSWDFIAANITLERKLPYATETVGSILYNEEWYNRLERRARWSIPGFGGAKKYTKEYKVNIRKDTGSLVPGILRIEIVSSVT